MALKNDGTVWAWGNNNNGQVGDGTTTNRPSPFQVPGLSSIIAVGAGNTHSLAVRSNGTVLAWGNNTSGQLGDAQIAVLDLRTGKYKSVLRSGSHAHYVKTGHLVYGASGTLRAIRFDLDRLERQGVRLDSCRDVDVALQIGSPLGTVKSWIRRGLQSLRACLES